MGILKARNLIGIFAASYAVLAVSLVFSEITKVTESTRSMTETVATAAETAITQALASDEFFSTTPTNVIGAGLYGAEGITSIKVHDGVSYTNHNIFQFVYGTDDKDELYKRMYGSVYSPLNNEDWLNKAMKLTVNIFEQDVPQLARMGLLEKKDGIPTVLTNPACYNLFYTVVDSKLGFKATQTYDLSTGKADPGYPLDTDWLGYFTTKKYLRNGTNDYYYLAPTNVGVTYLDPAILQTAFVCNMDLLMRAEAGIEANGIPSVGYEGTAYTLDTVGQIYEADIVNNGKFAYYKGKPTNNGTITAYREGTSGRTLAPEISYKCIDVTDPNNKELVRLAVGIDADKSYEAWLEEIGVGKDISNNFKQKYILVAKVTFKADVIIPYTTSIAREYYSLYDRGVEPQDLFFQVPVNRHVRAEDISTVTGNEYYTYTTYFAVAS